MMPRFAEIGAWVLAMILPPLLHAGSVHAIASKVPLESHAASATRHAAIELDLHGLHVFGLHDQLKGFDVSIEELIVGLDSRGVTVRMLGLAAAPSRARAAQDAATTPTCEHPGASACREAQPEAKQSHVSTRDWAQLHARLHHVPISIATEGELVLVQRDDLRVSVQDPTARIAADGQVTLEFVPRWQVTGIDTNTSRTPVADPEPWRARTNLATPRQLDVAGTMQLGDADPLQVQLSLRPAHVVAQLRSERNGHARVEATRSAVAWEVDLDAQALALAPWQPLTHLLPARTHIALTDTTVSGRAHARIEGKKLELALDAFALDGLFVAHPRLSPKPVEFRSLLLDGYARVEADTARGAMIIAHDAIQVELAAMWTPRAASVEVSLPTTDCQALLDGLPHGVADLVRRMRVEGHVAGRFAARFSPHELVERSNLPETTRADATRTHAQVEFDFPFLDACTVIDDPPEIRVSAVASAYRHRYLTDRGVERERLLAVEASDFVPLVRVPLLAHAFVTLEDARFWHHDGFDREQIERAFWHNLQAGGIRRGASTITQQTARNLWLGVDRSLSRKLQEAILTARLEATVGKARILELYLNLIELGPEVHGVREAAAYYFGKSPAELTPLEALHIASLAPAPRAYARQFADGKVAPAWLSELRQQARRMHMRGWLTSEELRAVQRATLQLRVHAPARERPA